MHNLRSKLEGIGVNTHDGMDSYERQTRVVEDIES